MLDGDLSHDVWDSTLSEAYIQDFFVVLALCNTVVLSRKSQTGQDGQCSTMSTTVFIGALRIYRDVHVHVVLY